MPPLSVVMPVHNALPHLDEAVESILGQTFEDFEFVILDDASTDGSGARLKEWAARDSRIRLLESKQNLGPVGSSNMVARAARAAYVARMDADDVSYPTRLAEQLRLLRSDETIGVSGSLCDMIDACGRKLRGPELWRLSRPSVFVPFAHGSMMYRRELFDEVGGYREACEYWEDQDLVVRMSARKKVAVFPTALYQVRVWRASTRVNSSSHQLEDAVHRAYLSTDRLRHNRGYDDLLGSDRATSAKVDPRVFIALGSVQLWAGAKPKLFRRLMKRGEIGWNVRTLTALVWTAWASVSPLTLRHFLMLLLKIRNGVASPQVTLDPLGWQPVQSAAHPQPIVTANVRSRSPA